MINAFSVRTAQRTESLYRLCTCAEVSPHRFFLDSGTVEVHSQSLQNAPGVQA